MITGRNLQKAVVWSLSIYQRRQFTRKSELTISFNTGKRLPKYGFNEATEQILLYVRGGDSFNCTEGSATYLGTRNSAAMERMSNAMSVMYALFLASPIILATKKARPTRMMAMSHADQKSVW